MTPEIDERIAAGRRCMLADDDGERCPERAEVSFKLDPGQRTDFLDLCIPHARLTHFAQHQHFADYIMQRELELAAT